MIYHIVEPSCYQRLTNGLAIPEFARRNNIEHKTYSIEDFLSYKCDIDSSNNSIFFTESAFLRNNVTLKDVRKLVPNGKIVNIGSDTIYSKDFEEISDIHEVDLWLDTMSCCVRHYNDIGIKAEKFRWTISESFVSEIEKFEYKNRKDVDFICLARQNSPYRKQLAGKLLVNGYFGYWGTGTITSDLPDLGHIYNSCYVCIGTSSPAGNINIRSMKGFRDWIAPFFGTVLIYDKHIDMMEYDGYIDWYEYNSFESLSNLIIHYREMYHKENEKYQETLEEQKFIALEYSIEKQFQRIFDKYGYLNV